MFERSSRHHSSRATDPQLDELAALRAENERLRDQVEELSAFAGTVAHDLKGPLASMIGFVSVGGGIDTPDDVRRVVLERAVGVGRRMEQLIDGLLGYARSGSGDLCGLAVDLRVPVAHALEVLDHTRRESDATLHLGSLLRAVGDQDRLTQVVQNLLANALQHGGSAAHAPVVHIGSTRSGDEVELWVEDEGDGIPADLREAVLTPFVRGPDTHSDGTGLGLATSRRLVEAMGGRLSISTGRTGGARVSVHLPAAPMPDGFDDSARTSAPEQTASTANGSVPPSGRARPAGRRSPVQHRQPADA